MNECSFFSQLNLIPFLYLNLHHLICNLIFMHFLRIIGRFLISRSCCRKLKESHKLEKTIKIQ